jgi:hypothetical protein
VSFMTTLQIEAGKTMGRCRAASRVVHCPI